MFTVKDLHEMLEKHDIYGALLYKSVWGKDKEVITPNPHNYSWLETFECLKFGEHTINIPSALKHDADMETYIETMTLYRLSKYEGPLLMIPTHEGDGVHIWNKEGPVLFTDLSVFTYVAPDGHIEQYSIDGRRSWMDVNDKGHILRVDFQKVDSDFIISEHLEIPFNLYKNPSNKKEPYSSSLLESGKEYWGESLFFNPILHKTIMVRINEDFWVQTPLGELRARATGHVLDELNFIVGVHGL